jgi:aminoglycoside phosphotransferase (APT) family kinase protein
MERVRGDSLGTAYWAAPSERRGAAASLFWGLVADLHRLDGADILSESPLAAGDDPYRFADGELQTLAGLIERLEGGAPASLRAAFAWLRDRRDTVPCDRAAVVHGDFHPNNVLVRADGAAYVIDWSNVRLGDCRTDLAWSRLITRADAQPDQGEAELRAYERFAGRDVSRLDYFEVAACLRLLLSVLISERYGAADQGLRPESVVRSRERSEFEAFVAGLLRRHTAVAA